MNIFRHQLDSSIMKWMVFAVIYATTLCYVPHSTAAEVEGLYDALVPISERSEQARAAAIRQGFRQVITKITGSSKLADSPKMKQRLKAAAQYVNGFSYQSIAQFDEAPQQLMSINFSPQVVNSLLREERLPIWPAEREPLLIWVVVDDAELGRQLVSSDSFPEVISTLQEAATLRGLPLVLPVLDLQDRLNLKADDAWQLNPQALQMASTRYQAKNWLVIRFYQSSQGQWRGSSWLAGQKGEIALNNHQSDVMENFTFDLVSRVVDDYSTQFSYIPQARDDSLALIFEGVESYQSFKGLRNYLQGLEIVSALKLQSLEGNELKLDVAVEGDKQIFFAALERDVRFKKLNDPVDDLGLIAVQRFKWLGE